MDVYLYILLCADGSYYVGITRGSLELRLAQHDAGTFDGYTARRRPVRLVFHQAFDRIEDAIAAEHQVKGWRRDKKDTLIRGELRSLSSLSQRGVKASIAVRPSRRDPTGRSSG
jgi:putative endonuclease